MPVNQKIYRIMGVLIHVKLLCTFQVIKGEELYFDKMSLIVCEIGNLLADFRFLFCKHLYKFVKYIKLRDRDINQIILNFHVQCQSQ